MKPIKFYTTTFLITWICWFTAGYLSSIGNRESLFGILMILGLAAPFGTALWLTFSSKNEALKKSFLNKLFNFKLIKLSTIPIMVVIMPAALIISICISLAFGYSAEQFQLTEHISFSTGIFSPLLAFFLIACFEELGWRGYAIESLQTRYNYFTATLIFGVLWSLWHFPLFFIANTYHGNIVLENIWYAVNFHVGIISLAFIIGWIYKLNRESIIIAVLFHFVINISQEAFHVTQFTKCIETGVLTVFAGIIVACNKKLFFTRS